MVIITCSMVNNLLGKSHNRLDDVLVASLEGTDGLGAAATHLGHDKFNVLLFDVSGINILFCKTNE